MVLRRWEAGDREAFAALNADPEVMEHFPAPLTRVESDAMVNGIEARFEEDGFGFWALETADTNRFIGFTGLGVVRFDAPFTPAVEIGWRLARSAWGHGYAAEAARRALRFAFDDAHLDEVVSFTSTTNLKSQAVMKRIGMTHDTADDFDHPLVADGHRLKRHVLWRRTAAAWHLDHAG
ncbi:N-acetyltransferase [Actinomadura sp. 7K507]|nr:N-acetyltransferase [Actinomadura sp. 7K507]